MTKPERILRIAAVQIECHPAFYAAHCGFLDEPFLDDSVSLAKLGLQGLPVTELQSRCLKDYVDWQTERVIRLLRYLGTFSPVPHLIVFPEYSIPWQALPEIQQVARTLSITVCAGTHTAQLITEALNAYKLLGFTPQESRKLGKQLGDGPIAYAPVITPSQIKLIAKKSVSPFERTELTKATSDRPEMQLVKVDGLECNVVPIVCSDALQDPIMPKGYDLVGLLSYDRKPEQFTPFIQSQTKNRHPVIYCNDARYGGTAIHCVHDSRSISWFHDSGLSGGLPAGEEAMLVVDVDLDHPAIEVGTADPKPSHRLIAVRGIRYEQGDPATAISRKMASIPSIAKCEDRSHSVNELLKVAKHSMLQAVRLRHVGELASKGLDDASRWDAIGSDCILPIRSLRAVEAHLAQLCSSSLKGAFAHSSAKNRDTAFSLVQFLSRCDGLSQAVAQDVTAEIKPKPGRIINRVEESKTVLGFIDNPRMVICEVLGREQIGKTTVLEKVLGESGLPLEAIRQVTVTSNSSAEFVLASVVEGKRDVGATTDYDLKDLIKRIPDALKKLKVVVIENAHNLLEGGVFRNDSLELAVKELAKAAAESPCKLVIVSRRTFPQVYRDAPRCQKVWIQGLERERVADGVTYLDYQFRRVGLSPLDLRDQDKQDIVNGLGGHPVALGLAADNALLEGAHSLLKDIRERRGFWRTYVNEMLGALELTAEQQVVLKLLSMCRTPIASEIIQKSVDFNLAPEMRALVSLCLIDIDAHGHLWLSGLLRGMWDADSLPDDLRRQLRSNLLKWYQEVAAVRGELSAFVEAEYHAGVLGVKVGFSSGLIDGQISTAWDLYEAQRFEEAKKIADKLLIARKSRDILRLSALIDCRCNSFDTALVKAKEVFTADPKDTWLLTEIARAALTMSRDDIAETLIKIAQTAGMEDSRVALTKGRMLLRRDQLKEAIQAFERARDLSENDPWPGYYLGTTYLRMGKNEAAVDALEAGQEFFYNRQCRNKRALSLIQAKLGEAYLLLNDDVMADRYITPLYERNPDNPNVARAYAMLLIRKEGVNQAAQAYARLNEAQFKNRFDRCQFHLYYGLFLLQLGELGGANAQFALAHKADRTNVYVLIKWAKVLYDLAEYAATEVKTSADEGVVTSYARQCASIVLRILEFDRDNALAQSLREQLLIVFKIDLRSP